MVEKPAHQPPKEKELSEISSGKNVTMNLVFTLFNSHLNAFLFALLVSH